MSVAIVACSYIHVGSGKFFLRTYETNPSKPTFYELVDQLAEEISSEAKDFSRVGGLPTIPASSVKGNIRGRLELTFRAHEGRVRSCFSKASQYPPLATYWRHRRIWGDVLNEDRSRACDLTSMEKVCLICDLFGTTGLSSLINFEDFIGREVTPEEIKVNGEKILAAPAGSEFEGTINFTNLKEEELGLLFIGMGLKDNVKGRQLLLGRLKYRGLVGSKLFGRIIYVVKALYLTNYSRKIDGFDSKSFKNESELTPLIKNLTSTALQRFNKELKIVDEVINVA